MEEENDSTTLKIKTLNYFGLLQEIDKLLNLSTDANAVEVDTICNNVTANLDRTSKQMTLSKKTMFFTKIFNTLLRICATNQSTFIISRISFQSLSRKLIHLLRDIGDEDDFDPICASDILDSMLMNLAKDNLAEKCFLSNDQTTTQENSSQDETINFQILIHYIEHVRTFVHRTVIIQSVDEFKKNHKFLMISLLTYVNNCLINISSTKLTLIHAILGLLTSLTDKIVLIPMFVDFGYVEKIIQWIRTDIFASYIDKLGTLIFHIIHNLSRDKLGLERLQYEKTFDILMEHKHLVNAKNDDQLTQKFGATLIALATNDEPPEESKKFIVDTSRRLYDFCTKVSQSSDLKEDGYHLSELLELLHRVFWNTYVIESILKNETPTPIQFFPQLFLSFYGVLLDQEPDDLERIAAEFLLKILLQISSYPEYQKELIENRQLCIVIESLAIREKRKLSDAEYIWYNLKPQALVEKSMEEKSSSIIYISYDRTDQEFCKEFVMDLRDKIVIPVWVDYEHVESSEDMWKYLPLKLKKIKSATVIMILVSAAYGDENTDRCRESSYIITLDILRDETKRIIVINVDANYNFNRSWMINLLRNKPLIPYDDNISKMTDEAIEEIGVLKKLVDTNPFLSGKAIRKKTVASDGIPANSKHKFVKFSSTTGSDSVPISIMIPDEDLGISIETQDKAQTPLLPV